MRLYHTSNMEIQHPNIKFSRNYLDFGKGFYLTTLEEQALNYGQRFIRKSEEAIMNVYELDDDLEGFTRITFNAYDSLWLDYITACRKGKPHPIYDIIEGGIADDQVFDTIDLYFSGIYNREQTLNQLRYKYPNHQLCISNQLVIDKHLHFIKSIKL